MHPMPRYVFNPISLKYEVYEGPRYMRYVRALLVIAAACGLCWLYFWIFTSVLGLDLPKTARLRKENAQWQARIAIVNRQLDRCQQTLEGVEERDDHVYRSIFALNPIPDEVKTAGFGGVARYDYLDAYGANPNLKATLKRIDMLTKRTYVQSMALDEVYLTSLTAGDMVSHIPAVPPILPDRTQFHLASPFGRRIDPVYGGVRHHGGQDFAARRGYPVYATGDGVVETTRFQFTGYGNEIIINHGFGYKTRYAHLSHIDVAPGIVVHRGDQIGAIGSTGKATGPHLHYEVIYKGTAVNPYSYMDLSMSVDEYRAMTEKRRQESAPRLKSSMELLRQRR